jgi:hypothetical protein
VILQLFAGEDQPLILGWDASLVLDEHLQHVDGVAVLHVIESDGFAFEVLHKDLHYSWW